MHSFILYCLVDHVFVVLFNSVFFFLHFSLCAVAPREFFLLQFSPIWPFFFFLHYKWDRFYISFYCCLIQALLLLCKGAIKSLRTTKRKWSRKSKDLAIVYIQYFVPVLHFFFSLCFFLWCFLSKVYTIIIALLFQVLFFFLRFLSRTCAIFKKPFFFSSFSPFFFSSFFFFATTKDRFFFLCCCFVVVLFLREYNFTSYLSVTSRIQRRKKKKKEKGKKEGRGKKTPFSAHCFSFCYSWQSAGEGTRDELAEHLFGTENKTKQQQIKKDEIETNHFLK